MLNRFECTIDSEGFDAFFCHHMANATDGQIALIPESIRRIQRNRLTFFEKLFVLFRAFNKTIYLVAKDEKEGLTPEQFCKWDEEEKKRAYNTENSNDLVMRAGFVLGDRDVCNGLLFQRNLGATSLFKYLSNYHKNKSGPKPYNTRDAMQDICKMLMHYEGLKKKMLKELAITIPEWYTLLHFANGEEKSGLLVYSGVFAHAANSSRPQLHRAMRRLVDDGYLQKFKKTNGATYRITPLGIDLLQRALSKYVTNF